MTEGGQGHFVPVGAVAVSAGAAVVLLVVVAKVGVAVRVVASAAVVVIFRLVNHIWARNGRKK